MRRFLAAVLCCAFIVLLPASARAGLRGRVLDPTGAVIRGATVTVYGASQTLIASTTSDESGAFSLAGLPVGSYELEVRAADMDPVRRAAVVRAGAAPEEIEITLHLGGLSTTVTVTSSRGEVQDSFVQPVPVNIVDQAQLARRPMLVLPLALKEETGIQVQQTSANQGAVIVRGLTGQQVLHLFDGVRFNNSTFRPGPNQYLATVDPGSIERVEVVRGPGSSQYGSDSIGGTVNLLSVRPQPIEGGQRFHAAIRPFFRTADLSAGGSAQASFGGERWNLVVSGGGTRVQDLRAGGGGDSHAAVTRFLGLPSSVLGGRLQDTGFAQFGGQTRFGWRPSAGQNLTLAYHRGQQSGARRYDQLNGGKGDLVHFFDPQIFNLFYARWEKQHLAFLDTFSATFSLNQQQDDRRTQGGAGNPLSSIDEETNGVRVFGYQAQATTHIGARQTLAWGGEIYDESIDASRFSVNPLTQARRAQRARFPDGSRYGNYGAFAQHAVELFRSRLRVQSGVRYSAFRFRTFAGRNPFTAEGQPTVPDFSTTFDDVTFNTGAAFRVTNALRISGTVSRGFRAPNATDFSAIGLSSNGFEVSPDEARRLNATLANGGDSRAVSTGVAAGGLLPESAMNYEVGATVQGSRASASAGAFHYTIADFITKRAIALPGGAVGQPIGGQPIVSQNAAGLVFTGLDARPVLVRANAGRVRMRGIDASFQAELTRSLFTRTYFSYLRGIDVETGRPPEFETGLPPANGYVSLRWQPGSRPFWVEAYSMLSWRQDRLSSLELADQRIGATRSRSSIAAYFNNGAVARGLVRGGRLAATGETLAQVQDRVLGPGVNSAPMFLATPGYAALNLRGGIRTGRRSEMVVILENLFDRNYRYHGSGVDGPGLNVQVGYSYRF